MLAQDETVIDLEVCRDYRYLWGERGGTVELIATSDAFYVLTDGEVSELRRIDYEKIVLIGPRPGNGDMLSVVTDDGLEVIFNHRPPHEGAFFEYVRSRTSSGDDPD